MADGCTSGWSSSCCTTGSPQLAVGGMMVLPVGTLFQNMTIVTETSQCVTEKRTIAVRFVPMVDRAR